MSGSTTENDRSTMTNVRTSVQKFGTALSNMIMPNIAAFIAWGLITALFIEVGWFPVPELGGFNDEVGLVGPMIIYMLPILIAHSGGKMVYGTRGAVVGVIATMGVIVGTDIPMFIGAMIMGPLGRLGHREVGQPGWPPNAGGLRDARQQLLRRDPGRSAGSVRPLPGRPTGDRIQ